MSAATTAEQEAQARIHAVDDDDAQTEESSNALATPLDLLLADAARSPLRRFVPGMSGVRFAAGLARHPPAVARRAAGLAAELAKVGARPLASSPPTRRTAASAEEAWVREPVLQAHPAGLPRRRRGGPRPGRRRRPGLGRRPADGLHRRQPRRGGWRPSNNPFLNPKVLKRTLDTGGGNLVEGGRRFVRDFATPPRVPSMVEADAFEVGARHRGDARGGGAAHRRLRADPVHPADPQGARGAAADRPADDQQVLRHRPAPSSARMVEHLVAERPAGLLHLLAQPRRPARRLGPRHLRPGDPRGDGGLRGHLAAGRRPRSSASARAG